MQDELKPTKYIKTFFRSKCDQIFDQIESTICSASVFFFTRTAGLSKLTYGQLLFFDIRQPFRTEWWFLTLAKNFLEALCVCKYVVNLTDVAAFVIILMLRSCNLVLNAVQRYFYYKVCCVCTTCEYFSQYKKSLWVFLINIWRFLIQ